MLHTTHTELHGTQSEIALSRFTSCLLLGVYCTFLYFQLVTHRDLFDEEDDDAEDDDEVCEPHPDTRGVLFRATER